MYCRKCKKEFPDDALFCPICGTRLQKEKFQTDGSKKKKRRIFKGFITLAGIIALLCVGGIMLFILCHEEKYDPGVSFLHPEYRAAVKNGDGKYGYINTDGEEVITCKYDYASSFWTNGVAVVGNKRTDDENRYKYGLINSDGEPVTEMVYDGTAEGGFAGLIPVAREKGIDEKGDPVLSWGFVNKKGEEVTEFIYQYETSPISSGNENGLIVVSEATGWTDDDGEMIYRYGVINGRGEEVLPVEYHDIPVSEDLGNEGMILVGINNGDAIRYGYVDYANEMVIDRQYEQALNFRNGLAAVRANGRWGYIDKTGAQVIPCQYTRAENFADNGLAVIQDGDGTYRYINRSGKTVLTGGWYYAKSFQENGLAEVGCGKANPTDLNNNELVGVIDENGEYVLEAQKVEYVTFPEGDWPARVCIRKGWDNEVQEYKKGKYHYVNEEGRVISGAGFEYAWDFGENGWGCVHTSYRDEKDRSEHYTYKYVNEKGGTELILPEKYIVARPFSKV